MTEAATTNNDDGSSTVREVLGRGSIYTIATAMQAVGAIAVLPAVTRSLDAAEFGVLAVALVVTQITAVIAPLGLPAAITRAYFDTSERSSRLVLCRRLGFSAWLIAFACVSLIHLTGPAWVRVFTGIDYGTALQIAVWTAAPQVVLLSAQALLRARDQAGMFVASAVTSTIGGPGLGLVLLAQSDGEPERYLVGLLVGTCAGALVATIAAGIHPTTPAPIEEIRRSLALGLPTIPHVLALLGLASADRVILERLTDLDAVGRYQVGYSVGALAISVLVAFNNAWAPRVYAAPDDRRWTELATITASLLRLAALVTGAVALAAPFALVLVAPPGYRSTEVAGVAALVVWGLIPYVVYLANVHVVFQRRRTAVLAWSTPVAALLNVGLCLALVPHLDLLGAAAATIASYTVLALLVLRAAKAAAPVRLPSQALLVAAVVSTPPVALGVMLPIDGTALVVRAVLACGFGIALVRAVRSTLVP